MTKYQARSLWARGSAEEAVRQLGLGSPGGGSERFAAASAFGTAEPIEALAAGLPDLVIDNVEIEGDSIDDGDEYGPNFQAGDTVRLDWAVDNRGSAAAGASQVAIRLISDVDGMVVDTNSTDAISAGGSDTGQYDSFIIPSTLSPGLYGIEIVADDQRVVSESSESNNTYLILIRVEAGRADLVIDNVEINGTSIGRGDEYGTSVMPGDTVRVDWDVDNDGSAAAGASRVALRLVSDVDGMVVDTNTTDAISAGGSDTGQYDSFVIPSTLSPGLYGIELIADDQDVVDESSESNNDYLFLIRVGEAPPPPAATDLRDTATDTSGLLGAIGYLQTTATSSIGPADADDQFGDKDVFELTLEAGKTYRISMTGAAVEGFAALNQSIFTVRSINSFNTILGTSSEGLTAVLEFEATQGGKYFLRAGAGGTNYTTAQGGYRLQVQGTDTAAPVTDPGSTISTALAVTLTNGTYAYSGLVGGGDTADVFKVTAPTAGRLNVTLTGLTADIDLLIQNGSGGTMTGPSYRTGTQNENLSFDIGAGQTVFINAYPATPDQGHYTLNVSLVAPEPEAPANYRTGDHLFFTLAEFMLGAYPADGAPQARERLVTQGWSFFHENNIANTPFASVPWHGVFYEYENAQAVVAKQGDALVIAFRGTDFAGSDIYSDVINWIGMTSHYDLFRPLISSVEALIRGGGISKVYVTGHSLGAAMVDIFMSEHPKTWNPNVVFAAVTFAHPDITDGHLPNFVDDRLIGFHNSSDIINLVDSRGGHMPVVENKTIFSPLQGSFDVHGKAYYHYTAKFLYDSGVTDFMIRSGLDSPNHNDFQIPLAEGLNNTLTSRSGGHLMLAGYGNDFYDVIPLRGHSGDTIVEVEGFSDWLRLRQANVLGGLVPFQGGVRLMPSGRDLLVYPVKVDGTTLPYIRIYNHFADSGSGRVEYIEWDGHSAALPTSSNLVDGWNNVHYKFVSGANTFYSERSDGTIYPLVKATGGSGLLDTANFELGKMPSIADLSKGFGNFSDGGIFKFSPVDADGAQALSALSITSQNESFVTVDLTDIEHLIGTEFHDEYTGSDAANALEGRGGDDLLIGGVGNDTLDGGQGSDILSGGPGEDSLDGGSGADQLAGGLGDDSYFVDNPVDAITEAEGEGTDRVYASVDYALATSVYIETLSTSDDSSTDPLILAGNELDNRIVGNAGANLLYGMGGTDRLEGLAGNDRYIVDRAADVVVEAAGQGYDTIYSPVSYTLAAGSEVEVLSVLDRAGTQAIDFTGNEYGNALYGNAGRNRLVGGGGDDVLTGGAGADRTEGGRGNDMHVVDNAGDVVVELAGEGTDTVATSINHTLAANVETLRAVNIPGSDPLSLTGNALGNFIYGTQGNNVLNGAGGADFMAGYAGNDFYFVDNSRDLVYETAGQGSDTVATSVNYTLAANVETLRAVNIAGSDPLSLTGNALGNFIYGTQGNNVLNGAGGADFMAGYAGNDIYHVDNAGDVAYEIVGGGNDTVAASINYTLAANVENLQAANVRGSDPLALTGNALANYIWGTQGNNVLNGAGGADVMIGYGGNDFYYVDNAGDVTLEEAGGGADTVAASSDYRLGVNIENLQAANIGGTAALSLTGNEQGNYIWGTNGNNIIAGRGGNDRLFGYGGADQFLFDSAAGNSNFDWLSDFQAGVDKIVLDNKVFTALADGALPASAFVTGTAAADAGDRIIFNSATGGVFYDADGNGAGAALLIAFIPVGQALTAADFLVI